MTIVQIRITKDGILIPREYLPGEQFELVVSDEHVLIQPKSAEQKDLLPSESSRFSFVGIASSANPNASEEVENILEDELGQYNSQE